MIVGGVDLGKRRAAVALCVDGKLKHSSSIDLKRPGDSRAQELFTIANWCRNSLKVCDFIVIEEPLVGRSVKSSIDVATTAGAVMSVTYPVKSTWVNVKTWKREIIGNGNADKEAVKMWLKSSHPSYASECAEDQDRIDASCIALYGAQLLTRASSLDDL